MFIKSNKSLFEIPHIYITDNITKIPNYLLFTAPYKICGGVCKHSNNNFLLKFPLYIGSHAREAYKNKFSDDFRYIHKNNHRAPFPKKYIKPKSTVHKIDAISQSNTEKLNRITNDINYNQDIKTLSTKLWIQMI